MMLVKELNLINFKREFEDYFTEEGAEILYSYLVELFQNEEKAIKKQFDFILFDDLVNYDEEQLNIVGQGRTGVLVQW